MQVRDVMMSRLIVTRPDHSIVEAARVMLANHISGLPVVDSAGDLVGIVTEGDFLRRIETATVRRRGRWLEFLSSPGKLAEEYTLSHGRMVAEVMTADLQTVTETASLDEVVRLMEYYKVKRVPVVRGTKLVGMVTRSDLMRAVVSLVPLPSEVRTDDVGIRTQLNALLIGEQWAPAAMVNPIVHGGIVELWGTILDERQRTALKVASENIPGVRAVRDHLVWIEPTSGMYIEGAGDVAA